MLLRVLVCIFLRVSVFNTNNLCWRRPGEIIYGKNSQVFCASM